MRSTVTQTISRLLENFKAIGDADQKQEAKELQEYLAGFRAQPAEAVSFAREDTSGEPPKQR